MNKLILFILLSVNQIFAFGQHDTLPLIKVTGEYSIKVKPDYVILGVSVNKMLPVNPSDYKMGFRIFEKDDTRVKLFDFDDRDISESLIHVNETENRSVYIKDVFITIKNIAKLDEILFELARLGFSNYKFVDYRVLYLSELKDKARIEAIKLAKAKAESMASSLGQFIGQAHTIEEMETPNYNWYELANKNKGLYNIPAININDYLFDPGYIVIMSKVKVSFDLIKPLVKPIR